MTIPSSSSPLDQARQNAERTDRILRWASLPPAPLILLGAGLLQVFSPGISATEYHAAVLPWYQDPFLLGIFAVYVFGQLAAIAQFRSLRVGLAKAKGVVAALAQARGSSISLPDLQARIQALGAPGHLADMILRWLRMGLIGESGAINALMERGAWRRSKAVEKKIGLHATLNRTMLKLGFLGTLLGLIVTFPPMKAAILTLDPKNLEKGASFVQHIAGAIDGDQYAILATMMATGLSLFIELLTIQILRAACGRFELVNASVDEWCLTELQPQIRREAAAREDMAGLVARRQAFQQQLLQLEQEFQEGWRRLQVDSQARMLEAQAASEDRFRRAQAEAEARLREAAATSARHAGEIQQGILRNLDGLARQVHGVAERMDEILPLQQSYGRRLDELVAYERQYRAFLEARDHAAVPRHLKPEPV